MSTASFGCSSATLLLRVDGTHFGLSSRSFDASKGGRSDIRRILLRLDVGVVSLAGDPVDRARGERFLSSVKVASLKDLQRISKACL